MKIILPEVPLPRIPLFWLSILFLAAVLIVLPVSAGVEKVVIYSSDFSKDPGFTTNNPSRYYWDVANEQYHFETEGGTNGYAFLPVEIDNDPFTLEYDINISSIEEDGAVRFGITRTDMDISKAANILGIFETGQYGRLMGLQVIDQNNHFYETKSLHSSYCGEQRDCRIWVPHGSFSRQRGKSGIYRRTGLWARADDVVNDRTSSQKQKGAFEVSTSVYTEMRERRDHSLYKTEL